MDDVALRGFMRIAVLDDDSAQADLVCQTLSAAGHICHAYSAGRELVRQLRRQTFDLLVLDWNVPDMSGEEVLRWVRESLSERLPVLFMTSRGREIDITSMLDIGADDYLVKPVAPSVPSPAGEGQLAPSAPATPLLSTETPDRVLRLCEFVVLSLEDRFCLASLAKLA